MKCFCYTHPIYNSHRIHYTMIVIELVYISPCGYT